MTHAQELQGPHGGATCSQHIGLPALSQDISLLCAALFNEMWFTLLLLLLLLFWAQPTTATATQTTKATTTAVRSVC
jgi:hypothetical protein